MAKNDFQYGGWNYYMLQCGTIMTLISPGVHPAMWQMALGWHAMEFAQTSAVLEFCTWFRFWPYHRSQHVILHQSAKFCPNRSTLSRKNNVMSIFKMPSWNHAISAILDFRGPIIGSLESPFTTSYGSLIENMALNCLLFEKIAFLQFGDRQKNRRTDGHARCMKPLSLSRAAT